MRQWNEFRPRHWHTTTRSEWEDSNLENRFENPLEAFKRYRPEVDILPGVTWKCSMRSAFSWFSEFCHSRRLSHFAASFIDTRAEGSIAKSCKRIKNPQIRKKNSRKVFVVRVIPWHPAVTANGIAATTSCPRVSVPRREPSLTVRFWFWKWIYIV